MQDSSNFLNKIDTAKNIPVVTLDVKSLHPNIPNSEGISAVKGAYESYPEKSLATKIVITFLTLILTLNNFMFNCKNYLQIRGCAMGTACAPSYANIFMARFEQKHTHLLKAK